MPTIARQPFSTRQELIAAVDLYLAKPSPFDDENATQLLLEQQEESRLRYGRL